ncbi:MULTISPECIES: STAS domain-containing protein [Streptomyces]|jgi:anti-anti-sigma factor|uniref:Anti-sigma factor antagonist n=1 Tax=Streptomyces spinosisporus TaxID=2927582 RepID=A0ABS9XID7_9ACTN|nr:MULTISPECIES: STAS domain-containing protein [Streptomyces]MCI3241847.1 STAS domain-containing protein [Streptomyces spinosisporus]WUB33856.1 STAS domain-containing protein [Streptomyces sp. NBC_00588]
MDTNHARLVPCHTERVVGGTTVVEVRGEIDIFTATPLMARLDHLTAGVHPDLVLDLRPVTFIDCSGLRVLCRTRNRVLARQGRVRLVGDSHRFLRILSAACLAGVFEIHPDLPAVLFGAVRQDEASAAAG